MFTFRSRLLISALATLFGVLAASASNGDIVIVANPGINLTEISHEDLSRIYLMTKTALPGTGKLEPVLEKSGQVHNLFLKTYIGRSDSALMTYYRSLLFTGRGSIPKSFTSDSEILDYVAKTRGAIGYAPSSAVTSAVKILKIK